MIPDYQKSKIFLYCWLLSIQLVLIGQLNAQVNDQELKQVNKKIKDVEWLASRPIIIDAVLRQNQQNLSIDTIKSRDQHWIKNQAISELKLSMQTSEAGSYIKSLVSNSKVFNEIFVTDQLGANVICYPLTSDYWQGDEEKFLIPQKTGRVYISPSQFDKSTQTQAVQVSVPILVDGKFEGVLIAGIKMNYLEYKAASQ